MEISGKFDTADLDEQGRVQWFNLSVGVHPNSESREVFHVQIQEEDRERATELATAHRDPNRLRELRQRQGLSQKALGLLIGVTQPQIVRWESGTSHPMERNALSLAIALGVKVPDLGIPTYGSDDSMKRGVA